MSLSWLIETKLCELVYSTNDVDKYIPAFSTVW